MANNLNSLILEGVVSGEPHLVETSDVLNFTVETTRYYKNSAGKDVEEKSSFKVVAFGAMSKLPLKDGMGVRLVGRLKQNTWTDNGVTHSEVQIVAEHIEVRKIK
jgi:single-stranded DNA-binding protein